MNARTGLGPHLVLHIGHAMRAASPCLTTTSSHAEMHERQKGCPHGSTLICPSTAPTDS